MVGHRPDGAEGGSFPLGGSRRDPRVADLVPHAREDRRTKRDSPGGGPRESGGRSPSYPEPWIRSASHHAKPARRVLRIREARHFRRVGGKGHLSGKPDMRKELATWRAVLRGQEKPDLCQPSHPRKDRKFLPRPLSPHREIDLWALRIALGMGLSGRPKMGFPPSHRPPSRHVGSHRQ